jgi:hypothetical protein
MNDLAQFQPAFNGVITLLAVSTNIETEQITNGNLKLKGTSSFEILKEIHLKLGCFKGNPLEIRMFFPV